MLKKILMACLCLAIGAAQAADPAPKMSEAEFVASLKFQSGKVTLPGAIATLDLPAGFQYLTPDDAERVLVEGWGNPPGFKSLGMIVPAGVSPLSEASWGVVVTYEKDGHVKDDDADSIKYDELLKTMQDGVAEGNSARKEHGYSAMTLVGWAEPPRYDKASHKLYWAKELKVEGAAQGSLNYNIRVLGREGVLVLNAVASMAQIAEIKGEMQKVTLFSEFSAGQRYADFDGKTDKVAEYGIAALVAGGVAAKLGLFGKLFALLLAFKKIIFIAVAAAGAGIFKFFGREKPASAEAVKPVDLEKRD
ncbi:MAG: DUF2167 domain-containing protein [Pseudomonadota bacterium]